MARELDLHTSVLRSWVKQADIDDGNGPRQRFVRSIKEECLGRIIFSGEASLRRALREHVEHYNAERPHQGIGNRVLQHRLGPRSTSVEHVECRERLGGLLRHYRESAA